MQRIPVTRDRKRGSEVIVIHSSDVVRIDTVKDREYIVHTADDAYYLCVDTESIEEWLFEDGFRLLDSTNIVNMNHIDSYDAGKGIVYLGDPRNKLTKKASAARIQKDHIENVLEMLRIGQKSKNKIEGDGEAESAALQEIIESAEGGRFERSYATIRAVYEKKIAEEKIVYMAYHDSLTNMPNRLMFEQKLHEVIQYIEQHGGLAAVMFLDLDRFKIINDTLGHHTGDVVLKHVAQILMENIQEHDVVARFSGDEFLLLINKRTHIDEIIQFAKSIPTLLKGPYHVENYELYLKASVGISLIPQDGTDPDQLIKKADVAMYRAKEKGGNSHQLYRAEMNRRSQDRLHMEADLHKALEKNEIIVYYQPQLNLETGRIFGVEALVRWKRDNGVIVPPNDFIPLAEETGLIVPIGNYVLMEACRNICEWQKQGRDVLSVAVNISALQFHDPGFVKFVSEVLSQTELDPARLHLEITESVAMQNVMHVADTMEKLNKIGVRISIDDFGTGYSSLSYLKRFAVHTLKIDQSFIRDLASDGDNAAIVTALIAMTHRLKLRSLAEGVETKEQLEFLMNQGCNEIQGFVFSKPLPPEEFLQLLKDKNCLFKAIETPGT